MILSSVVLRALGLWFLNNKTVTSIEQRARRAWIRLNDIVIVSPWDFQSDKRGDIVYRYRRNQADWLRKNGYLEVELTLRQARNP